MTDWILTSDKLPRVGERVLICTWDDYVYIDTCVSKDKINPWETYIADRVIKWMPLPKP